MAVWLGVGVSSACDVPIDPLDQPGVASSEVVAAGAPGMPSAAALGHLVQRAYVKGSNTGVGDLFGYSLALSADGSTLAVGAPYEDSGATGVGGNQADESVEGAGAVYVFKRHGKTWIQQAYLKASNTAEADDFGYGLALSADGSTLAVGASFEDSAATGIDGDQLDDSAGNAGAVYVFKRHGVMWSQQAYVKANNASAGDYFGHQVALSADGATLAVGAWGENGGTGAAYVFTRSGATWTQRAYVQASNAGPGDFFGHSVALSADASTLAVGAVYEDSGATGVGGNQLDESVPDAGAVYVFTRSGTTWSQQAYVKASNTGSQDYFGFSLALSADGSTLAVGAMYEDSGTTDPEGSWVDAVDQAGAVYVFARSGTTWSHQAYVKSFNIGESDTFGYNIALTGDGSTLAVGAPYESSAATGVGGDHTDNSAAYSGAAYVLARSGTTWSHQFYVKASNTDSLDVFGFALALSGDGSSLVVGAPFESGGAPGIDGDQADNSADDAGAVYVFDRCHKAR